MLSGVTTDAAKILEQKINIFTDHTLIENNHEMIITELMFPVNHKHNIVMLINCVIISVGET